jgi:hypothetical protein
MNERNPLDFHPILWSAKDPPQVIDTPPNSTSSARRLITMTLLARRLILAILVALHGAAVLGGPALHAGVSGRDSSQERTTVPGHDGSHQHQNQQPLSHHDDCPLCHVLTHGQHFEPPPTLAVVIRCAVSPPVPVPGLVSQAADPTASPRAPPATRS